MILVSDIVDCFLFSQYSWLQAEVPGITNGKQDNYNRLNSIFYTRFDSLDETIQALLKAI